MTRIEKKDNQQLPIVIVPANRVALCEVLYLNLRLFPHINSVCLSAFRLGAAMSFYVLSHPPVESHHHGNDSAEADLLYGCHEQDAGVHGHPWQSKP